MNRRAFVTGLGAVLAAPRGAEAQQAGKAPRIALVFANAPEAALTGPNPRNPYARAFLQRMRELGWVDGQNITIERRSTEGQPERLGRLAQQLAGLHVDLIVLSAAREAIIPVTQAIGSTPVVCLMGTDPEWIVRVGLAKSLARPGGTVTGLTSVTGFEVVAKRLQLLKEAVPTIARVAYLSAVFPIIPEVDAAARTLSLTLLPVEVSAPEEFDRAFAAIREKRPDAIFLGDIWFAQGHISRIVNLVARERIPAIYPAREFVFEGGLIAYGVNWVDMFAQAARYADKILKGAKVGDVPIERASAFELVINLKTAKALGLTIPPSLLLRADQIIDP